MATTYNCKTARNEFNADELIAEGLVTPKNEAVPVFPVRKQEKLRLFGLSAKVKREVELCIGQDYMSIIGLLQKLRRMENNYSRREMLVALSVADNYFSPMVCSFRAQYEEFLTWQVEDEDEEMPEAQGRKSRAEQRDHHTKKRIVQDVEVLRRAYERLASCGKVWEFGHYVDLSRPIELCDYLVYYDDWISRAKLPEEVKSLRILSSVTLEVRCTDTKQ